MDIADTHPDDFFIRGWRAALSSAYSSEPEPPIDLKLRGKYAVDSWSEGWARGDCYRYQLALDHAQKEG